MISGKYLTSASTRVFATAGNRVLTDDCYGSRRGETLQTIGYEESFQEIAQLIRQFSLEPMAGTGVFRGISAPKNGRRGGERPWLMPWRKRRSFKEWTGS
jgi:hypothetical protein